MCDLRVDLAQIRLLRAFRNLYSAITEHLVPAGSRHVSEFTSTQSCWRRPHVICSQNLTLKDSISQKMHERLMCRSINPNGTTMPGHWHTDATVRYSEQEGQLLAVSVNWHLAPENVHLSSMMHMADFATPTLQHTKINKLKKLQNIKQRMPTETLIELSGSVIGALVFVTDMSFLLTVGTKYSSAVPKSSLLHIKRWPSYKTVTYKGRLVSSQRVSLETKSRKKKSGCQK